MTTIHEHVPAGGVRPPVTANAVDSSEHAHHAREIAERKAGRRGDGVAVRLLGLLRVGA